jgi:3-oxoacyl-[acyl-carrier protein] reductase
VERVGLDDDIRSLPQGYDTELGVNGAPLSPAQVVRLVVARAVAASPRLIIVDDTLEGLDPVSRARTVAALTKKGVRATGASVDIAKGDELKAWVESVAKTFGGLDILVSNVTAGSVKGPEQWANSLSLDLMPLVHAIDEVTPIMEAAGGGSIVALSSTFGFDNVWPSSPNSYGAFKAAIIRHASAAGHALAPKGIRVNTVSPGPTYSEDGDWGKIKAGRPEVYEKVKDSIPIGRMGEPVDIANAVSFLCSDEASWITGQTLFVDGGYTASHGPFFRLARKAPR